MRDGLGMDLTYRMGWVFLGSWILILDIRSGVLGKGASMFSTHLQTGIPPAKTLESLEHHINSELLHGITFPPINLKPTGKESPGLAADNGGTQRMG